MPGTIEKSCSDDVKHEGDITSTVYHDGYIFTGGADGKIKIWDDQLNLKNTINIHESYIYALAINNKGDLYSSACDGTVKLTESPLEKCVTKELMKTDEDAIQCLVCVGDKLYSGDDKGVVTYWENNRISLKFNLIEEIKSIAVDKFIYTIRDLDAIVTEVQDYKTGKYSTRATIPGKSPLYLCGPIVDGIKSYLVFATRSGMGLSSVNNLPGKSFAKLWTKEDCHEMIINSICGTDKYIFTGGYDGFVKCWTEIDKSPKLLGEIKIGNCVNSLCCGNDAVVFSGTSDGILRRLAFL